MAVSDSKEFRLRIRIHPDRDPGEKNLELYLSGMGGHVRNQWVRRAMINQMEADLRCRESLSGGQPVQVVIQEQAPEIRIGRADKQPGRKEAPESRPRPAPATTWPEVDDAVPPPRQGPVESPPDQNDPPEPSPEHVPAPRPLAERSEGSRPDDRDAADGEMKQDAPTSGDSEGRGSLASLGSVLG